jgi:CheY-like chemotaxis protein
MRSHDLWRTQIGVSRVVDLPARTGRILIVDDSAEYVSFVQSFLEGEGFQVDTALSTEAMQDPQLARAEHGDLGRAFGDAARRAERPAGGCQTSTIPVLISTAAHQR